MPATVKSSPLTCGTGTSQRSSGQPATTTTTAGCKPPVLDVRGRPLQAARVSPAPELYFLGLHWMHTFRSGLFSGVGRDAEYHAEHLDLMTRRSRRHAAPPPLDRLDGRRHPGALHSSDRR